MGHLQHYFCSVGPGVCVAWLIVVLGSVASGSLFLCEAIFPSKITMHSSGDSGFEWAGSSRGIIPALVRSVRGGRGVISMIVASGSVASESVTMGNTFCL